GLAPTAFQRDVMAAAACAMHRILTGRASPELLRKDWILVENGERRPVRTTNGGDGFAIEFTDEGRTLRLTDVEWRPGLPTVAGRWAGTAFPVEVKPQPEGFRIRHRAASAHVLVLTPRSAELHEKLPPKQAADTSKMVLSPMPGLIVTLDVEAGQDVKSGQQVAVIEAMKMQNILRAERDGVVKSVSVKAGDSVAADEVLVEFA